MQVNASSGGTYGTQQKYYITNFDPYWKPNDPKLAKALNEHSFLKDFAEPIATGIVSGATYAVKGYQNAGGGEVGIGNAIIEFAKGFTMGFSTTAAGKVLTHAIKSY